MKSHNCIKRYFIIPSAIILVLFSASLSFAANVTFIKEYTYQASELDSKHSSRTISLEMVKRLLLEELGTYLISETEVKNMQLTKEQVTTYSAGIVSAEVIEEKWDGKTFWLKAKVSADPKEAQKTLKKIIDDKHMSKELEASRKKAKKLVKENERLKKELAVMTKTQKVKKYEKIIKGLNAVEWFERGYEAGLARRWQEAVDAFTKVIELRSDDADAYFNRGLANGELGNYQYAINDYTQAIELKLDFSYLPYVFHNRGVVYAKIGNYQQSIMEFTKAIEIDPQYAKAYYGRGLSYGLLGNYHRAITEFNKAIEINPQYAAAYYDRGLSYGLLGNQQQAMIDYKIAARLGDTDAQNKLLKIGEQW